MRISKLLSAVCASAFLAGSFAVRAQDNAAQAAARAALMGKMGELNTQQSPPTNQMMAPAIVVTPAAPAPPAAPANQTGTMATPPVIEAQPAGANDTAAQAAARAALLDKMSQLNAQQNQPANPAPPSAVVMTPAKKPAGPDLKAQKKAEQKAAAEAAAKAKADADQAAAESKAKQEAEAAALKQAAAQTAATPPAAPAMTAVAPVVKMPPANVNYPGKTLGFPPVEAPPPPVSAQKQADLQTLLARYVANQISPEEYQKERAAILAGP